MKIRYIKPRYLRLLRSMSNDARIKWYKESSSWLDRFFGHETWYSQTKIELAGNIQLVTDGDPSSSDLENSILIYNAFQGKLTNVQASDARLWAYFSHETFWDYMIWRWPPESSNIESRYFVNGSSSRALSRNGIARLWWFAHLTYDENRANPYDLTKVFLQNQDIQHNLIERNFGRSRTVLHAILDFLKSYPNVNGKDDYVNLGKLINRLGGVRLLDCLTREEIITYLESKFDWQAEPQKE